MKRWIPVVVVAVVASGGAAFAMSSGGSSQSDAQRVAAWSQAWQGDAGVTAFSNELSGPLNQDTCGLAIHDGEALLANHPRAPFGEDHVKGMIAAELAEVKSSCAGDTDGTIKNATTALDQITALAQELLAHGATDPHIGK